MKKHDWHQRGRHLNQQGNCYPYFVFRMGISRGKYFDEVALQIKGFQVNNSFSSAKIRKESGNFI
ncbi:MAG: hypothetical protein DCO96_04725 [Fluviicola sp. XM-24bin1]|nr:MAG: hypothetical protein DCO96_04725 [Fluviicola sp. XM-24bin1]